MVDRLQHAVVAGADVALIPGVAPAARRTLR